jgi:hypothetical protein
MDKETFNKIVYAAPKEKDPDSDSVFYVFGELIGCVLILGLYAIVPVLIIATCLKILFF